jgi:hypothetical protein
MANEITLGISLAWSKLGQSVSASVSEKFTQAGNAAAENVQTITDTTAAINIGSVAGDKFLLFKNRGIKDVAETTTTPAVVQPIIYIDTVTPVVPGEAPIRIHGGMGDFKFTATDAWYAICDTGLSADLGVVAVEA